LPERSWGSGRKGRGLESGEDLEVSYVACALGVGNFPELKLTHLIPKERLKIPRVVRTVYHEQAFSGEYIWLNCDLEFVLVRLSLIDVIIDRIKQKPFEEVLSEVSISQKYG
jgi:hypothetical protein